MRIHPNSTLIQGLLWRDAVILAQILPGGRAPLLDGRAAGRREEARQLATQAGQDLLIVRIVDDVALLARISLQVVQLARPLLGPLHVFERLGTEAAHIAVLAVDAVSPLGRVASHEAGVAVAWQLRILVRRQAEIIEQRREIV